MIDKVHKNASLGVDGIDKLEGWIEIETEELPHVVEIKRVDGGALTGQITGRAPG